MTEAEWLVSIDPDTMLEFLVGKVSDRKFRLFGCACVRDISGYLRPAVWSEPAINVAERFADGDASEEEMVAESAAMATKLDAIYEMKLAAAVTFSPHDSTVAFADAMLSAYTLTAKGREIIQRAASTAAGVRRVVHAACGNYHDDHAMIQADCLRDIMGNPFKPPKLIPTWVTSDIHKLAYTLYQDRDLPSGKLD